MSYLEAIGVGLGHVFSWPGVLIPLAGTLLAMFTSFLPGIGSASLMAVMLVMTMSWDPESVLLMFGALTGGATFMGSITAILFNIPGGAPSAAALLDGYPMGRNGYPKTAIACAATASAVGSVFGVVVLVALLPVVRPFLLEFGPLERLLLGVWGLTTIVAVPNTPPLKSLTMAVMGLVVAMIGSDPGSGDSRWTFGFDGLRDGIGVVPALLGFFTFAEIAGWARSYAIGGAAPGPGAPRDSVRAGVRAVFTHPGLTIRSSVIGTLVGIIPGVGGTVAGFLAYGQAVQTAKGDRSRFGKGDIRGVIAPEAAVDAKDGGSLLPAVAFGLPGSEAGVMLVTALTVHGLVPGTPMLSEQLPLTMTLILALLFSNLLTSAVGVMATPWLAQLTRLNVERIALPALVVSAFAVVQVDGSMADLYVALAFGLAGWYLKRHAWPRVPFVIAFVLGEFIESNLTLSLRLVELGRVAPLERPATLVILALIVVSMAWMYRRTQSPRARRAPARADTRVAVAMAAACVVFALAAAFGEPVAAPVPLAIVAAGFGLSMVYVVRGMRAADATEVAPPASNRRAFGALVWLSAGSWLLGLVPALGLLVAGWMAANAGRRAAGFATAVLAGLATALAAHWLASEWANLILPRGALLEWFAPASPG